ncbi:hypothetical protein RQP46_008879 [Phenoliferia psychrophenolica]
MAVARLRKNQTGITNRQFKLYQAKEFALDIKTYLFFFLGFVANIPNGGISNFSTLIIQGLGFDTLHTALLGIPQGVFVVIWIGAGAWLNTRLPANSRTIVCMLFMIPTIAGTLGFLLAPRSANVGRLICFSYRLGIGSMLCCNCLEVVTIFALRVVFQRENARRERDAAALVDDGKSEAVPHVNETAFLDLTDKENIK